MYTVRGGGAILVTLPFRHYRHLSAMLGAVAVDSKKRLRDNGGVSSPRRWL